MAKYLIRSSLGTGAVQGLIKEGGTSRRAEIDRLLKNLGGTLEAFYYAFGDDDVLVIADLPDNVTAAAVTLMANSSGLVVHRTTVLITPEEMDEATRKTISYRPPGR